MQEGRRILRESVMPSISWGDCLLSSCRYVGELADKLCPEHFGSVGEKKLELLNRRVNGRCTLGNAIPPP